MLAWSLESGELAAAAASFNTVLASDPGNNAATRGLRDVEARFTDAFNKSLTAGELAAADELLAELNKAIPKSKQLAGLQQSLRQAEDQAAAEQAERLALAEAE